MNTENWKIIPSSVRAHCCKPQHPHKPTKDVVRALNSADCLEKRQNKTRENIKNFAVYSHFPPNVLGGPDGFSRRKEESSIQKKLRKLDPQARLDRVPEHCKSILMSNSDLAADFDSFMCSFSNERQEKLLYEENEERITFMFANELAYIDDEGKLEHGIPANFPVGYDGTFYVLRDLPYVQLFSIAILKPDPNDANKKISVPVVMSLMKKRTISSYTELFKVVKSAFFEKFGRELKISHVVGDYECASRAAFIKEFGSSITNCLFHTKQNRRRKIREHCGIDHFRSFFKFVYNPFTVTRRR